MCAEYLDKLPELHKKVLNRRLVGIYFIENFMGSGMADFVLDENDTIYCNLFINPGTLKTDITEWMTFRENTCFSPGDPDLSIVQDCGKEYTGLMYILLHETSHIVDYVCSVTPYIDAAIKEIKHKPDVSTGFTQGVWEKYDTPEKAYDFNGRSEISFYGFKGGPKISKNEAEAFYTRCGNTPFVSLYGASNWAEDWAESVTWYYFTGILHQPYEIQIYKAQELIMVMTPMDREKVKMRIPVIEEILAGEMDTTF
ncbi:MAG: hypothetical protein JXJ04_00550, partial [Spirochaetales bacterium]|nr:hypothetical protein [Spirochaetales bacterium]